MSATAAPQRARLPPKPPSVRRTTAALLRKDLQLELRTGESVPSMLLFSLITFVLFHFGLGRDELAGQLAAGVLVVTLLFAAVLGMGRLFVAEREQGGFEAFLLAPVDRTALLFAKAAALMVFLLVVEIVAVPAFGLLLLGPDLGPALPGLVVVLLLLDIGLAVLGTLVSAIAIQTRARDLILPVVGLPLLLPLLIGAARAAAPVLAQAGAGALPGRWLLVLALYDLVFGLLAWATFDYLLED